MLNKQQLDKMFDFAEQLRNIGGYVEEEYVFALIWDTVKRDRFIDDIEIVPEGLNVFGTYFPTENFVRLRFKNNPNKFVCAKYSSIHNSFILGQIKKPIYSTFLRRDKPYNQSVADNIVRDLELFLDEPLNSNRIMTIFIGIFFLTSTLNYFLSKANLK